MHQLRLWTKLYVSILSLTTALGCRQSAKLEQLNLPEIANANEEVMVDTGSSSQPVYSKTGKKILFVSSVRPGHTHPQVYEKDLTSGEERRITFQNGSTAYPKYHPSEKWILYSSSTDELKENPPLLAADSKPSKFPPTYQQPFEIYQHALQGLDIKRLTQNPGFDGEASFSKDGKTIFFTRRHGQLLDIRSMASTGKQVLRLKGPALPSSSYVVSPDGKHSAWVEWDKEYAVGRLKLRSPKNGAQELAQNMVVHKTDLQFSPDSRWLLWSQLNTETSTYQLWAYEIQAQCLRRLTAHRDGHRRDPVISPDMKWLAYTTERKARSRIVKVPFAPESSPCVI